MKLLLALIILSAVLSGCGSRFSKNEGYNISGVGLVPDERCFDTTYVFREHKLQIVTKEVLCPKVDGYKFEY